MSSIIDSIKNAATKAKDAATKAVDFVKSKIVTKGGKRTSKRRTMKGGSAYQHTIATYGGVGEQHAQNGSNVIAANAGAPTPAPEVKGGKRKSKQITKKHRKSSKK